MTATLSPPSAIEPPAPTRRAFRLPRGVIGLMSVAVAAVALNAGFQLVTGGSTYAAVLPAAVLVGAFMVVLALVDFESFILLTLVGRSLLDWSRGKTDRSIGTGSSGPWAAAVAALLILAGVMWLIARRRHEHVARSTLEVALLAFLATAALSLVAASRPVDGLVELARIGAAVMMFFVVRRLLTKDEAVGDRVLTAVFASALIPVLVAGTQAIGGGGLFHAGGYGRARGTFVHPNPFALYLTILVVMGVALLPHLRLDRQVLLGVLVGVCGVALLFTYTRTGWLAAFVALLVVGVLQSRKLILVLVVGAVIAVVAVPAVSDRFDDLRHGRDSQGSAQNSLIWRVDYWKQAVDLAGHSPVIGIGLNMTQSSTDAAKEPHNDFIRAYAETGVLGLAAYVGVLAALIRVAIGALRRATSSRDRGIAVGFAGCVVAFLLFSLVSNVVSQVVLLWYFFAFAAAAAHIADPPSVRRVYAQSP